MHRYILNYFGKLFIDHADMSRLNNQKENLRFCNNADNGKNRPKQLNNTSGYKGVSWHKASQK